MFIFILSIFVSGTASQENLTAEIISLLNIRQEPSTRSAVITVVNSGTPVFVEGRNEFGDWLLISTQDGSARGWVAIGFVRFSRPVRIMEEIPFTTAPIPSNTSLTEAAALPQSLTQEDNTGPAIRAGGSVGTIIRRGQANGLNSAMFIKIGDSNIANEAFLCNIERNNYDLGPNQRLQAVVDHFNISGSFCHNSVTAGPSFTTLSILDPTWAAPGLCNANETPLDCEIRRSSPAFAFVYLGSQDIELMKYDPTAYTPENFRQNLSLIVRSLKDKGVVPIVSTFATNDSYNAAYAPAVNDIIREVATAERVPLIDLRSAVYNYDNHGTAPDGYHLSTPEGGRTDFNGNQNIFGRTHYEFLALEMLSSLTGIR